MSNAVKINELLIEEGRRGSLKKSKFVKSTV